MRERGGACALAAFPLAVGRVGRGEPVRCQCGQRVAVAHRPCGRWAAKAEEVHAFLHTSIAARHQRLLESVVSRAHVGCPEVAVQEQATTVLREDGRRRRRERRGSPWRGQIRRRRRQLRSAPGHGRWIRWRRQGLAARLTDRLAAGSAGSIPASGASHHGRWRQRRRRIDIVPRRVDRRRPRAAERVALAAMLDRGGADAPTLRILARRHSRRAQPVCLQM